MNWAAPISWYTEPPPEGTEAEPATEPATDPATAPATLAATTAAVVAVSVPAT